jgi:hypothetical protein
VWSFAHPSALLEDLRFLLLPIRWISVVVLETKFLRTCDNHICKCSTGYLLASWSLKFTKSSDVGFAPPAPSAFVAAPAVLDADFDELDGFGVAASGARFDAASSTCRREFEPNQELKRECRLDYLGDVVVAFQLCPLQGAAVF